MSIQILGGIVSPFDVELMSSLCMLDINPLSDISFASKYLLSFKKKKEEMSVRNKLDILKVFSSLIPQTSPQIIEHAFSKEKYSLFL